MTGEPLTPREFLRLSLDEIAGTPTDALIRLADLYVQTLTTGAKTALTGREVQAMKSCIRVIVAELERRGVTRR